MREDKQPVSKEKLRDIKADNAMIFRIALWELRDFFKSKKLFFLAILVFFMMASVYASSFLQMAYLIFFKPSNLVPFPITITYYLLFMLIPIIAVLAGHDLISSEIENKTIKNVITKVRRESFVFGKFLALLMLINAINFIFLFGSAFYSLIKFGQLDLLHPFLYLIYLFFYSNGICAVTVFFSSVFSKGSGSLLALVLFFSALIYIGSELSIFYYIVFTLAIIPVLVFIAYFVIFVLLAMLAFRMKDL